MNEYALTLDLAKGKARQQQTVFVRQGDKSGTTIVATITDHGAAAATSGMTARFSMRLPNGTEYYRKAASLSGNTATVTIDETQAASVAGRTDVAYFQLLQGSTVVASTESFTVVVLPDALADAEVAESYDSAIQDAIDALDAAVADMPDMVEDVLADHPEWTTTVQDGSITKAKLATDLARDRERLLYRLANMLTNALPEGDVATASDAAKTPVAGLALYGRSTQDGTPTPSAPVAIQSVEPDSSGNVNLLSKRTSDVTQQSVTPIPLQGHALRSLPDGTRDEVTVGADGRVTLVQRVGSVTLDGSESWYPSGGKLRVYTQVINSLCVRYKGDDTAPLLCDRFERKTGNQTVAGVVGVSFQNDLQFAQTGATMTVADWKTWLASNPTTVLYPLMNPVTIDLGWTDAIPLCGPDLTAQSIPTAPFALTYERDLNATLARLEAAIAALA